ANGSGGAAVMVMGIMPEERFALERSCRVAQRRDKANAVNRLASSRPQARGLQKSGIEIYGNGRIFRHRAGLRRARPTHDERNPETTFIKRSLFISEWAIGSPGPSSDFALESTVVGGKDDHCVR